MSRGESLALRTLCAALFCGALAAQAPPAAQPPFPVVEVRAIQPPETPLPSEPASAGITKFSFIAYGDTRSGGEGPGDGEIVHPQHSLIVDGMLEKIRSLAPGPYPVKFVVQSGDAVLRGQNGAMWNVSFSPVIEKLTRDGNVPYFLAAGNHDVTTMPLGHPTRMAGLTNLFGAMSRMMPLEGSPRRLNGYPTYAFGYGNLFVIAIDSNIANDPVQLRWVTAQLERLDRARFPHVVAVFHHPIFSSGPHGGDKLEPQSVALRDLYTPLFRRHRVRMTIAGHDHLLDHFVERYTDSGVQHRRDDIVTGGGGAPIYAYSSEPDLLPYVTAGMSQHVRVEHLIKPGPTREDNPHHFVVVQVDGDRLSLEVVAIGGRSYQPYGKPRVELSDRAW